MKFVTRQALFAVALLTSIGWAYLDVFRGLIHEWHINGDYSHGFHVVPVAVYLCWIRKDDLRASVTAPSTAGLVILLISLALLTIGTLGSQFLARLSLLGTLIGAVLFIWGPEHLRICAFPIAFLAFMIPPPSILFDRAALTLQILSSSLAEHTLVTAHIPVLREGNVIMLPQVTLDVAEACSGIRSLVSLVALGVLYSYFVERRFWARALLVIATVPIAVLTNALRVSGTAVAAQYYGLDAAMGFFHTFSGMFLFIAAFLTLSLLHASLTLVRRWSVPADRMAA